jgi:TetR/AcrR family transcriptional repressor of nem operon
MPAGRPKVFVEDEAIDKATQVFWKCGYKATSTADLLVAMDMGKGSMYHTFGGKKKVFNLALEKFADGFIKRFSEELSKAQNPVEYIKTFFRSIANQSKGDHKKGCFLGNTIAELASVDPSIEKRAIEKLKMVEEGFSAQIKDAQQKGLLKNTEDPILLGRYLINLWNGVNITRRMYPDSKDLLPLIEIHLKQLF